MSMGIVAKTIVPLKSSSADCTNEPGTGKTSILALDYGKESGQQFL